MTSYTYSEQMAFYYLRMTKVVALPGGKEEIFHRTCFNSSCALGIRYFNTEL